MSTLTIDGSEGEGGGQILRTTLSLSAITGRPVHITKIRAGRSKSGLRPQHLTVVRALAAVCDAEVEGDQLGSKTLSFHPAGPPHADDYLFDVQEVAPHGSAGSVTLILQALLWPLVFADTQSKVTLRGGTHVPFSPPFHWLDEVARPAFAKFHAFFDLRLDEWGWIAAGKGQLTANIRPVPRLEATTFERVEPVRVQGVAAATNLPSHIPQRMASRAHNLLRDAGLKTSIRPVRERAAGPGAGIFLWLTHAGASHLGRQGVPSETVAEAAVAELMAFVKDNRAAVDPYLADQLLLPMALAHGRSSFSTNRLTSHTLTVISLLRRWLDAPMEVEGRLDEPGKVTVTGVGFTMTE